ncbi:MAG TPA: ABC transporter substrate-binding protein [Lachnospiraceae bacterium]|nr:ABC transporter substrate-binding protein [Lachnospiraceae bacterium]
MKKLTAAVIAGVLAAAALTGCGGSGSSSAASGSGTSAAGSAVESSAASEVSSAAGSSASSETGSAASEAGSVAESSAASEAAGSLTTVKDGVLTMGTNAYFPPYEYYEGEEVTGIDVEIARAIADKLGLTLEVEDMDFDAIITAVQGGKVDMGLAGMTVTPDRQENVNFSDSYATGVQVVIVKEDSEIATPDDLADGKKIGVQLGTTGDTYASDTPENGGYGEENVEKYSKGADAVMALVQGKVDAVIIDNEPAKSFVESNEGLKILETEYVNEDYAAAISKDNDGLLDAVNGALSELKADGTIQSILDKYISAN